MLAQVNKKTNKGIENKLTGSLKEKQNNKETFKQLKWVTQLNVKVSLSEGLKP